MIFVQFAMPLEWRQSLHLYSCSYLVQKQPQQVFCKKRCSQKFSKIHRKTSCARVSYKKVVGLRPSTLLKITLVQVFSCECFKIFKNMFSHTTAPMTASICQTYVMELFCEKNCHRHRVLNMLPQYLSISYPI